MGLLRPQYARLFVREVRTIRRTIAFLVTVAVGMSCVPGVLAADSEPPRPAPNAVSAAAGQAWSVLPPGNGNITGFTSRHINDQRLMYDRVDDPVALGTFGDDKFHHYFKDSRVTGVPPAARRIDRPRGDVEIHWDNFGVPHVFGDTNYAVSFGAGWAVGEGRLLVAEMARRVGRKDNVSGDIGAMLSSAFDDSAPSVGYTEEELEEQLSRICDIDPGCEEMFEMADGYVAGMNAWIDKNLNSWLKIFGVEWPHWRRTDLVASAIVVFSIFGNGGGAEPANGHALRALIDRFGETQGRARYDDLRGADAPGVQNHIDVPFEYPAVSDVATDPASIALLDDGFAGTPVPGDRWFETPPPVPAAASRWLAVSGDRTASGHPHLVGGPQMGYSSPGMLFEISLYGGDFGAAGVTVPGIGPLVVMGHTESYAWTATSAGGNIIDERIELLCDPGGGDVDPESLHYVFDAECIPMQVQADPAVYPRTVHGPVVRRATVDGRPVAVSIQRASRGFEAQSAAAFKDLNFGRVGEASDFPRVMHAVAPSFNWAYVNDTDIAYSMTGRFPRRAPGTHPDLPTWGTGQWEWQGYLDWDEKPHAVNPADGYVASWNNKIAPGWRQAGWGAVGMQRVDLIHERIANRDGLELADSFALMQDAATSDLRGRQLIPEVLAVLEGDAAPSARLEAMRTQLKRWSEAGAHWRDTNHNWFYDDAGVAIIDSLVPELVRRGFDSGLGGVRHHLPLPGDTDAPASKGSAFQGGRDVYLQRDLQRLLAGSELPVYCGAGNLEECRNALWGAFEAAYGQVKAKQWLPWNRDSVHMWRLFTWPSQLVAEPRLNPLTMRWQNRATYQQVITFG